VKVTCSLASGDLSDWISKGNRAYLQVTVWPSSTTSPA
jgi:hypothetical protein